MTPERFLEQFGHLADAPNGIAKLRELILQLAVRGKLVPQDPSDEPASLLLERIAVEKERTAKKSKALPAVALSEIPFGLPAESWSWTRLGEVTNYGDTEKAEPSDVDEQTWVLELEDVEKSTSRLVQRRTFSERKFKSSKNKFTPGDVIYGKLRPYLDKVLVADSPGVCTTEMVPTRGYFGIDPLFLRWILKSPYFIAYANNTTHGMNLPRLGTENARLALIPLAPTNEQSRIVAKVDQLMSLCDELEAKKNQRTETHNRLVRAAHHPLTQPRDHAELQSAWRRIRDNFDQLHTTLDSVRTLRQTILQLAVQGKLVPQDPNDEPASALLEKIRAEKERLVAEGKVKKANPLPSIKPDEVPFEVPQGWAWVRFNTLIDPCAPLSYGVLVPGPDTPTGVPFVRLGDLDIDSPAAQPAKRISAEVDKQYERTRLAGGEILMGVVGSIGKLGLAPASWRGANIARAVCRIQVSKFVVKRYVIRVLQSEIMQSVFHADTRTLAQPTLNVGLIRNALVPLPPAREQWQIVQKTNQLLDLCDELESKIRAEDSTAQRFAEAVLAELAA